MILFRGWLCRLKRPWPEIGLYTPRYWFLSCMCKSTTVISQKDLSHPQTEAYSCSEPSFCLSNGRLFLSPADTTYHYPSPVQAATQHAATPPRPLQPSSWMCVRRPSRSDHHSAPTPSYPIPHCILSNRCVLLRTA